MSALLSFTQFPPIFAPSEFSGSLVPTHTRLLQLNSLTRHRSGIKLGTCPPLINLRCCSTMSLQNQSENPSSSQDSLFYCRAFWVTSSIIAWNVDDVEGECYLYASRKAALCVAHDGIQGHDVKIKLKRTNYGLPQQVIQKFPHIRDYAAFDVPKTLDFQGLVKCQLAVGIFNSDGKCASATGLQLPGILDELFSYNGPLGATFATETVSLYLWAPTAQAVQALVYKSPSEADPVEIVQLKELDGVWSAKGPRHWEGCYYVYEVSVYHPSTLRIEKCVSNDPCARGLSADGKRTLLVNLDSDDVKPEGWDSLQTEKPDLLSFSDVSIYELHVRDFSANDPTVPHEFQGGYLAFTLQDSAGVQHLKRLSSAGITHIHLLPTFQFAGVEDEKHKWKHIDIKTLNTFPPDSEEQQTLITAIQNEDGYNWGYNPVLWGVPKGSYASNANGPCRIIEFRKMVQALNRIGLRVVLDVVYNHLHASGNFDDFSVLDKIVPGYFLRRNADGGIEHSTCVNNTASEYFMVERLILDDLKCWAVHYKIDGFRFDLMGHIMKSTMMKFYKIMLAMDFGTSYMHEIEKEVKAKK